MDNLTLIFRTYLFISTILFILNILFGSEERPLFGLKLFNTRFIFIILGFGAYIGPIIVIYKILSGLLFFIPDNLSLDASRSIFKHWNELNIKAVICGVSGLLITGLAYYKLINYKRKDFLKYFEE